MWYAVYNAASGALMSFGTVVADPLPEGAVAVPVGHQRPEGSWNAATHTFDAIPASVTWPPQDFMGRFTVAEETAIRLRAMTDPNMVTFLARVERARSVTNTHPDTINGMAYCVAVGAVTPERRDWILSGAEVENG